MDSWICEEAIEHIKQSFKLSPRDPLSGVWHMNIGLCELCRGRIDAAIKELARNRRGLPILAAAWRPGADAKTALAEARRLNPQITIKWFKANTVNTPMILEGLQKAGLPDE